MKDRLIYHFFSDDDLLRISNKISESEKTTSGEIRISVRERNRFLKGKKISAGLQKKNFTGSI